MYNCETGGDVAIRRLFLMLLICSTFIAGQNPPPPSLTTIYHFTGGSDGGNPSGRLVIGAGGVLYGVTSDGGANNLGTVFSLTPPASPGGSWTETVLYSFTGVADGGHPNTNLVVGSGGVLYGTTGTGGIYYGGTVFAVTPPALAGGTWTLTVLHSFGRFTLAPGGLAIGSGGTLFGGTIEGGTSGYGMVYALLPPISPGGAWTEGLLYGFTDSIGSALTFVIDSAGILYGTAAGGGTYGQGMIYSLAPPASPGAMWTETVLHSFAGASADGMSPWSPVVIGSGGVLYGSTVANTGRSRLDDRDQISEHGDNALALEAGARQQVFPLGGAAFFASRDGQHVQVAHQSLLEIRGRHDPPHREERIRPPGRGHPRARTDRQRRRISAAAPSSYP